MFRSCSEPKHLREESGLSRIQAPTIPGYLSRAVWTRAFHDRIDFTDMLPIFAEFAGADLPAGVKLDGRSFVSSLRGDESVEGKWE